MVRLMQANEILFNRNVAPEVFEMRVYAPEIAKKIQPGQFIIIKVTDKGERIPLSVGDFDRENGTLDLLIREVGVTTKRLVQMEEGVIIPDIVGPLGKPTELEEIKHLLCVGGGVGIAPVHVVAKAYKERGAHVTTIFGARSSDLLAWKERIEEISDETIIATDDGSEGIKGVVTLPLENEIISGRPIDLVFMAGPAIMMKFVADVTRKHDVPSIASLNPIMVDGTGMCGACRVTVGGVTKFACVDGPDFDGNAVDFPELLSRQRTYMDREKQCLEKGYECGEILTPEKHKCKLEQQIEDMGLDISIKERMTIDREKMPEQSPRDRIRNFNEVPLGFTEDKAKIEARRCLQCKHEPCVKGCPVNVKIPQFIALIAQGKFTEAARKIKETNSLPAVCGRVCPQEIQCEGKCVRGKNGYPVAVGHLERFCADYEREKGKIVIPEKAHATGKKIAVIGSGPSGLTVAGDLIKMGHDVTIFEALHQAGGVLAYGIPEFRLPKEIVASEVDYLRHQGVKIELNKVIGATRSVEELVEKDGYDAVFIGVGAGLPMFLKLPGENLNGVYSANEYLTRVNLMKAYLDNEVDTPIIKGKNVTVIGGGNVAMDSLRTALRLEAKNVYCVYRRTRNEMPARKEEIHHAEQEGVQFKLLRNPVRILGDGKGWVKGLEVMNMKLGQPDSSGRRRPEPIPGSEYIIETDLVIIAIGAGANPLLTSSMKDLQLNRWGYVVVDEVGHTSKPGVWAGGDIVTGAATVILAAGAGKTAVPFIHDWVMREDDGDKGWPFEGNKKINE
jgi:glutamate synthase (NADPH/NADH) small chain